MPEWLDSLKSAISRSADAVRDAAEREAIAFAIGKTAGRAVTDDAGNVIVDAGFKITPEMAERARQSGKLQALVASVANAGLQDLQEKLDQVRQATPEGQEDAALDSIADYAEARRYVGRTTGVDVTDVRGNVVIPAGTCLTEADVRRARQHGLLQALVHSVQLSAAAPKETPEPDVKAEAEEPLPDPAGRARLPLVDMPHREDGTD